MKIGSVRVIRKGDNRVPVVPESVARLVDLGAELLIEEGLGDSLGITDREYGDAGAVIAGQEEVLSNSDMILSLHKPATELTGKMKPDSILVSFLDPFEDRE